MIRHLSDPPRSLRGAAASVVNGVRFRYPICCVLEFAWRNFRGQLPGEEFVRRHGSGPTEDWYYDQGRGHSNEYVPCRLHARFRPGVWRFYPVEWDETVEDGSWATLVTITDEVTGEGRDRSGQDLRVEDTA